GSCATSSASAPAARTSAPCSACATASCWSAASMSSPHSPPPSSGRRTVLSRLFKGAAMSAKKKAPSTATMLLDPALPLEHRKQLLMHLCMAPDPDSAATIKGVLDAATNVNGGELYAQKIAEVNELLEQMKAGP